MAQSFRELTDGLAAPTVQPGDEAEQVAAFVRTYIEAREELRTLPLGAVANAVALPAGGRK